MQCQTILSSSENITYTLVKTGDKKERKSCQGTNPQKCNGINLVSVAEITLQAK